MQRGRAGDRIVSAVAGLVPNLASRVFGMTDMDQLTVGYRDSPLSEDRLTRLGGLHRAGVRPGDRAPDARLVDGDGRDTKLFDRLYGPVGRRWGWWLFAFDGHRRETHAVIATDFARMTAYPWVQICGICAEPPAAFEHLLDLDGVVHDAYGLTDAPALLLIRPDGHVAYRGGTEDIDTLEA